MDDGGGEPALTSDSTPRLIQRIQEASRSLTKEKGNNLATRTSTPHGNSLDKRSSDHSISMHLVSMVPFMWTPSRDPKARSITFDPHLLPFVTILSETIQRITWQQPVYQKLRVRLSSTIFLAHFFR